MGKPMSSDPTAPPIHGEILTGVQRRRRWSTAENIRFVEESQQPGSSVSFVARRYGISPSLLFWWKRRMLEGGHHVVQADEEVIGTSRVRELKRRDLERLLGRKTMEVEILREALDRARKKPTSPPVRSNRVHSRKACQRLSRRNGAACRPAVKIAAKARPRGRQFFVPPRIPSPRNAPHKSYGA
jgi:transposase